jgi:hypothetical protein
MNREENRVRHCCVEHDGHRSCCLRRPGGMPSSCGPCVSSTFRYKTLIAFGASAVPFRHLTSPVQVDLLVVPDRTWLVQNVSL